MFSWVKAAVLQARITKQKEEEKKAQAKVEEALKLDRAGRATVLLLA